MQLRRKVARVKEWWIYVRVYGRKGGRCFGLFAPMTVALSHFPDHAALAVII